jgi:hypothetical protein
MDNDPLRVIIRVRVTDIPGIPVERVFRLGNDFCLKILGRPIRIKVQAGGFDAMHFLPNFDSSNPVNAWFLYDFNVRGPLDRTEVLTIRHEVYLATRQAESW